MTTANDAAEALGSTTILETALENNKGMRDDAELVGSLGTVESTASIPFSTTNDFANFDFDFDLLGALPFLDDDYDSFRCCRTRRYRIGMQ